MTQLTIVTTPQNSGDGTPLATAFNYTNSNFNELYARVQSSPPLTLVGITGDLAGMYAYDPTYFYYCFANYDGSSIIWAQVTQVGNLAVTAINNGTSNVQLVGLNGDATISVNGVSNIAAFRTSGAYVTGLVSATGDITGSNVTGANIIGTRIAGGNISATGNIVANNIAITGYISANAGLLAANAYPGAFVDGIVVDYVSGNGRISVGAADAITFYNNGIGNTAIVSFDAQGNINTGGTINSTGNILTQGIISATGNIETAGYFVGTFFGNVTGNFVVPGSNTQVVFNTAGNADAVGGFTYNKDSNTMIVLGIVSSQGNIVSGNVRTAGQVSATGNIAGGNLSGTNISGTNLSGTLTTAEQTNITSVGTLGALTVTANIQGGNLRTAGSISATGNIKGGNLSITDVEAGGNISSTNYTGTSVSVAGTVTGSGISSTGNISATGNIIGSYILGNGSQLTGVITNSIQNGNSNVLVGSSAGNVSVNVNGISPISLFTPLGQTISGTLSATGTITAGNLLTGGTISATSNITGGNLTLSTTTGNIVGHDVTLGGAISTTGSVTAASVVGGVITGSSTSVTGIVTAASVVGGVMSGASLTVATGSVTLGSIINGNANGVGNIGASGAAFNTIFATATTALYADLAECYLADAEYAPGTVLSFGGNNEVTISITDADALIVGVVSTNPAYKMNSALTGDHVVEVALTGRVPCQVQGPVTRGAMMVSAGNGRARAEAIPAMGTVIGKAVESFTGDIGTIEIVVGRL